MSWPHLTWILSEQILEVSFRPRVFEWNIRMQMTGGTRRRIAGPSPPNDSPDVPGARYQAYISSRGMQMSRNAAYTPLICEPAE